MNNKHYDVFLNYRRETGRDFARTVQQAFRARGLSVFFDYDSLRDGKFDETILTAIENSDVFVAVYSEGSLDRCRNEGDWVRIEIEHALQLNKKVVPVAPSELFAHLSFPEDLPRSLDVLRSLQTTEIHTGGYFDHSVDECIRARFPAGVPHEPAQWATVSEEGKKVGGSNLFLQGSEKVRSGLRKLEATEEEKRSGFKVEHFGDDVILVSDDVDAALRAAAPDAIRAEILPDGNPFAAAMEDAARDPVRERIRAWWKRIRGDDFKNESKIGLASDVLLDNGTLPSSLAVFRTDYFSSYRTNELATKRVDEEEDGEQGPIWEGGDHFPWKTDAFGRRTMQSFSESGFSNHLGGNTLGVTDDGMLVLWLQSGKAERSQGCWAPTGSGSLDWKDLDKGGSFLKTIANGAEREMKEEGLIRDGVDLETIVLGFYRWCSRGGLPGFLCVSRIGCGVADLSPNKSEVCTPKGRPLSPLHAARTPGDLQRSVDLLLEEGALPGGHPLSIPLLANLHAVQKALAAGDSRLDFLFGR